MTGVCHFQHLIDACATDEDLAALAIVFAEAGIGHTLLTRHMKAEHANAHAHLGLDGYKAAIESIEATLVVRKRIRSGH